MGRMGQIGPVPAHVWLPTPWRAHPDLRPDSMRPRWWRPACSWWPAFSADLHPVEEVQAFIADRARSPVFLGASIALTQMDLKEGPGLQHGVPAGYMVLAWCGRPGGRMFHLVTHAFFKAMLFLLFRAR